MMNQAAYRQYFVAADSDKDNVVNGQEAFGFFLKSHLPNNVLGQIWEVSDTGAKGFLTEAEFYTAMSLVGVAQAGGAISPSTAKQITEGQIQAPHPKFDGFPDLQSMAPLAAGPASRASGWKPTPADISRYQQFFHQTDSDRDQRVGGRECVEIFKQWGLPKEYLKKVWDTVDRDTDGFLNEHEFCTALAIMEGIKSGNPMPEAFPIDLVVINAPGSSHIPQSSALSLSSRLNEIALEPLPQSHSQTYNHPPLQSQVPPSTLAEQGFSIPPRDKSDIDNLRQSASELERKNHELQGNIHSQRAQQNAILNEKQALVRFKAKMDSELNSASIELEDLSRKTRTLEQELVSRREEAAAAQERMKQRAIESDALEKKLAELMAIKAQLNVADEDEGKTSEQLKYEVEDLTVKLELLENKSKLLEAQSLINLPATDLNKSSDELENEARALETKVELLQRKAKSAEKIEWLENLNRDMESAFQEDFEDDGFDEVPDEDDEEPSFPNSFSDSNKQQSAPAASTVATAAVPSFADSGFANENAFGDDPFGSLHPPAFPEEKTQNDAMTAQGPSDSSLFGAPSDSKHSSKSDLQAMDNKFDSFGFGGDDTNFQNEANTQSKIEADTAFSSDFGSTTNGASFQADGAPADSSFGASFFPESNEAGNGNTGFDSAFPEAGASQDDPFATQEPEQPKADVVPQTTASDTPSGFNFENDAFASFSSNKPPEGAQAGSGPAAFSNSAFSDSAFG